MTLSSKAGSRQEISTDATDVLVIPQEQHPITIEMIDPDALLVLKRLKSAGFYAYLVGGGVRDLYLGGTPKDFDISTDAKPGQLRKIFPNSCTIGRRFRLVQVFFRGGKVIEISTLRSLSEHDLDGPEQVLAPNNTFGTLSEDAQRRDLTINSLFYEIENNTIIDHVRGVEDLEASIVRLVGIPEKRINRDPVRMMRAIRHSARNNFTIEKNSWKAICANSDKLSLCPPSRLRDEILKDLYSGASSPWFERAMDSGIFPVLFPLYRSILKGSHWNNTEPGKLLSRIFKTIDRVNSVAVEQKIHRQPDFFLFALILIPWAESRFQILTVRRKGAQLFQISKQMRSELDQTLGTDLNLRRSLRQEIVNLLTNLATLVHNRKENDWPKWLQNKSYFSKCSLFYSFYIEASGDEQVQEEQLRVGSPVKQRQLQKTPAKKASNSRTRPAFSRKGKGSIFGFKK
ncbi:MAG: polya polymerase [Deltaproteobacteria bacterium]|nr:polya polymerase [Deltaproteobacteria bacterium]MBW2658874.1 polya polymerase [Deltaproteobacteria bacterium]